MARGRQPPASLRRRVGDRRPRKTLVVLCEGIRTEPEYLEALRRDPEVRDAAAVDIRIERGASGAVPLTLVRRAIEIRERARREEGEIDEVWCLYDVEWPVHHPSLAEARDLAARHGINLAVSNPCFELWLVLHFRDHRRFLDNDEARRVRREHDGSADKGLAGETYMPRNGTPRVAPPRSRRTTVRTATSRRTTTRPPACTASSSRSCRHHLQPESGGLEYLPYVDPGAVLVR
ncbi:RloB family protein [Dactylosporangium sp. CA-139066]|uniref:RloB family protein n=1 Tax=Dactylosporangium sp. CA-139066 TaxID=3239930 RepID=UPI003D94DFC4